MADCREARRGGVQRDAAYDDRSSWLRLDNFIINELPIQKHLVIDYPLIYTYGIYPYWRLR
jgi:hypothetical protein